VEITKFDGPITTRQQHKVVARVTFVEGSGTQARALPLTFRRCAQGAVAPRFTG